MDSHYPPVQRLMTPKPVFIHRVIYFKPSLTPTGEFKKTNQRIDKNLSVSMCLFSLVFEYRWKWTRINHVKHKHCTIAVYQVDNASTLWISDVYELVWVCNGWHLNQIPNYSSLVSTSMYSWFRLNNFSRFIYVCTLHWWTTTYKFQISHLSTLSALAFIF